MAWPPLALRKSRLELARQLRERSAALLGSSAGLLDEMRKRGAMPSALWLALRAANKLALTLAEHPSPKGPTEAQRRALLAARSQIQTLAAGILASGAAADPHSVEYELAQLISRTVALIDRVTADPPSIDTHAVSSEEQLEEPKRER